MLPAPELDKHGLFLMDYESHDGEVVTGMIGCGAQLVAFTTGRGTYRPPNRPSNQDHGQLQNLPQHGRKL